MKDDGVFTHGPPGCLTSQMFQGCIFAHLIQIHNHGRRDNLLKHTYFPHQLLPVRFNGRKICRSISTKVKYKGPPNLFKGTGIPEVSVCVVECLF